MDYETAPQVIARAINEHWEKTFPTARPLADGRRVQMAQSIVAALAQTGFEIEQRSTKHRQTIARGVDADLWGGD